MRCGIPAVRGGGQGVSAEHAVRACREIQRDPARPSRCLCTLPRMKILRDDDYWQAVGAHTSAWNSSGGAPWSLQLQVAALLGDAGIDASFSRFEPDEPTRWTVHVIASDGRLITVEMTFDAKRYDREGETIQLQDKEPAPGISVRAARAERLSDVSRLDFGEIGSRYGGMGQLRHEDYSVANIGLGFNDGRALQIDFPDDQTGAKGRGEEQRADTFVAAVRQHTKL